MKYLELTQGYRVKVDDEDYERLRRWKWYAATCRWQVYAVRAVTVSRGKRQQLFLHHAALRLKGPLPRGYVVDHINHDSLDCRKENLRICTVAQNRWNSRPNRKRGWSQYKGVSYHRGRGRSKPKWQAKIGYKGKRVHLGFYQEEYFALVAYNRASSILYGSYGYINRWRGPSRREDRERLGYS